MRRGLRQRDVAELVGCSKSLIGLVERGAGDRVTPRLLQRIAAALGARVIVRLDWNGEALDRLLDMGHAALVEAVVRTLRSVGWEVVPEATFNLYGERGSVDVLAWHPSSRTVLVVEVKSVVPDIQAMVVSLDRKARLGMAIARTRGWDASQVGTLLVIGDTRTSRRRVSNHDATFAARFPDRIASVRRFIADPRGRTLRGLWFLPTTTGASPRHRVPRSANQVVRD
jgi:hypothetical protein